MALKGYRLHRKHNGVQTCRFLRSLLVRTRNISYVLRRTFFVLLLCIILKDEKVLRGILQRSITKSVEESIFWFADVDDLLFPYFNSI